MKSINIIRISSALLLFISYTIDNQKGILLTIKIIIVVDYRENTMSRGINCFVEQYTRNNGFPIDCHIEIEIKFVDMDRKILSSLNQSKN